MTEGKSYIFTVDPEDDFECELKEKEKYFQRDDYTSIICDQVIKSEFQLYGISSNASLDSSTKALKSIVQIDIFDI